MFVYVLSLFFQDWFISLSLEKAGVAEKIFPSVIYLPWDSARWTDPWIMILVYQNQQTSCLTH